MAFKLHQSFYECLTKDSQNLISPDRVPEMESADKFYSPSLRIWPQKIRQEERQAWGDFFSPEIDKIDLILKFFSGATRLNQIAGS